MRIGLALLLPFCLLLAGCAGSPNAGPSDSSAPPLTTDEAPPSPSPTEEEQFVPKFHTHDYWGGRPSMILFEKSDVPIGQDALGETTFTSNAVIVGSTTFDTKLDGEDVNTADKTDVVFQGTERI